MTITDDALDLIVQPIPDMGPHCTGTPPPASDICWSRLETGAPAPLVLTFDGYGRKASDVHTIGMLFCLTNKFINL